LIEDGLVGDLIQMERCVLPGILAPQDLALMDIDAFFAEMQAVL